jgi:hypothetical protein
MQAALRCRERITLDTDHSPFFSRADEIALPTTLPEYAGGGRRHGARGDTLFGFVQKRRVGIALKIEILIAREHPLFTDNALELRQGTRIVGWAAARRHSHGLLPPSHLDSKKSARSRGAAPPADQ